MNEQAKTEATLGIVELMGHQRIAGRISQDASLGANLLRVDVPAVGEVQAYTRMFGVAAIYAVLLCTEATARAAAEELQARPAYLYSIERTVHRPLLDHDEEDGF